MEKLEEIKQYIEKRGEGVFALPNEYSAQIYKRKDEIFIMKDNRSIARIEVREDTIWIYMAKEDNKIASSASLFSLDDNITKIAEQAYPLTVELVEILKSMQMGKEI